MRADSYLTARTLRKVAFGFAFLDKRGSTVLEKRMHYKLGRSLLAPFKIKRMFTFPGSSADGEANGWKTSG